MTINKNEKHSNLVIYLIFIDILLLPNFPLFVMPLSLPYVLLLTIYNRKNIIRDREFVVYLFLGIMILISVFLSFLQREVYFSGMNVWMENIKRAFQLLTSFSYYFLIKNTVVNTSINLKKIMMTFITAYLILGLISYFDTSLYFKILELLFVNNPFVSDWFLIQKVELFRYSYIFIDPNNAIYVFQMIVFYMFCNEKLNTIEKSYLYFSIVLSVLLSMSTGGLISAIIFFVLYFMSKIRNITRIRISYAKVLYTVFATAFSIFLFSIFLFLLTDKLSFITDYSLGRMTDNTDGGRISKYFYMFKDKYPNIFGEGYILIRQGAFFRPHSDHLRFLYSYGLIAYLISIWFFFSKILKSSKYLFIIPAIMAFSINSLIDEQKVLIVLLCLVAYIYSVEKNGTFYNELSHLRE